MVRAPSVFVRRLRRHLAALVGATGAGVGATAVRGFVHGGALAGAVGADRGAGGALRVRAALHGIKALAALKVASVAEFGHLVVTHLAAFPLAFDASVVAGLTGFDATFHVHTLWNEAA